MGYLQTNLVAFIIYNLNLGVHLCKNIQLEMKPETFSSKIQHTKAIIGTILIFKRRNQQIESSNLTK